MLSIRSKGHLYKIVWSGGGLYVIEDYVAYQNGGWYRNDILGMGSLAECRSLLTRNGILAKREEHIA